MRTVLLRALTALTLLLTVAAHGQPAPATGDVCGEGQELYRAARFAEARDALRRCLDAEGPAVESLLPLVVMGVQEGRLTEAVEYGATAVELAPTDPEARYWYGRALLRSERTDEAKAQWESGLAGDVSHLGILEGLARLALAEDETAKAYQLLTQMQRLGASDSWLDRLMADIAAGKALWGQSLDHLQKAMTAEGGGTARDMMTASELSILSGDKPGAVRYSRSAVRLAPSADTYGGLGEAFFALEEVDSALVYLRLAIEQNPDNARFRFNLANALEVQGLVEEADYHFRVFLQQVPGDPVGHFNYGIHLDKMGRTAEALLAIDQAIALDPGMLTARVVRIQLLESLARWDEALAELAVLQERDTANTAELATWQARISASRDDAAGHSAEGKVHLLHLVVGNEAALALVRQELEAGTGFSEIVMRFSTGPAAARGGDVGWVDPTEMVAPMREAIGGLALNEISPPIESKGLYHIFKRIP